MRSIKSLIMVIILTSTCFSTPLLETQLKELQKNNEVLKVQLLDAYKTIASQDVQLLVKTVENDNYKKQYFLGLHNQVWLCLGMFLINSYAYKNLHEGDMR